MQTHFLKIVSLAICIVAAGCATAPASGLAPGASIPASTKHGWISAFYTAETPKSALPKCLADLAPGEIATRHFVKVDYRHARRMLVEVAELPETADPLAVHIGDHVQIIPNDCDAGQLSRITKFLP
jgi:hypothetical protein